jgi:hypothetical protein
VLRESGFIEAKAMKNADAVKMSKAGATRNAKGMCEGCRMKRGERRDERG